MRFFIVPIFLISINSYSQIDDIIRDIDLKEDTILSVFKWVVTNIEYDVEIVESDSTDSQNLEYVLKNKKGVCQHYALLFDTLIKHLGYEAFVIDGYVSDSILTDSGGHAWNAVKIKGEWYLYDPTWSSGTVDDGVFYLKFDDVWYKVSPKDFIYTHIPYDPIFQFLEYPYIEDSTGNYSQSHIYFNFEDSINLYSNQWTVASLIHTYDRIKKYSLVNDHPNEYLEYLNKNIQVLKFNDAIKMLNKTAEEFNLYIKWKKKKFKNPKIQEDSVSDLLVKMQSNLKYSIVTFSSTEVDSADLESKNQVIEYSKKLQVAIDKEVEFYQKLLNTWKPFRPFLINVFEQYSFN